MPYQPITPTPVVPNIRQVPRGGTPVISNGMITGYNAPQAGGLFHNIYHAIDRTTSYDPISNWVRGHPNTWPYLVAAASLGTAGAAGAFSGAGGAGLGGSASTVNPFAANAGLGTSWAPISAGIGTAATPASAAGFYGPAGNWTAGTAAGDFGQLAATQPWYNTFLGQSAINTGGNLLGGFLQNRAIGQAQNASNQQIQDRIRQALAALAPEQIMALAQRFLPQMAANMNIAGQTAIQGVREQAARTGQLEGPRALSFEAGTRAKLAQDVQQQAFLAAINNAGAQAGAITGAPYTPIQPQTGYADAIMNSINQAYLARALSQQPQYSPYRWPGQNQWMGGPY